MNTLLVVAAVAIGSAIVRYLMQQGKVESARGSLRAIEQDPSPATLDILLGGQHESAKLSILDRRHRPWSFDLGKEHEALTSLPLVNLFGENPRSDDAARISILLRGIKGAVYILNAKDYPPAPVELLAEAAACYHRIVGPKDDNPVYGSLQMMIMHFVACGYLVPARRL